MQKTYKQRDFNRNIFSWILFCLFTAAVLVTMPFFGIVRISLADLAHTGEKSFIFWQLRVPRTIMGFLAGSVLALSGLIFQQLFKNSLATPYTLGVSTGAAAGIIAGMKFNLSLPLLGFGGLFIFGFSGAFISVLLILAIARLVKSFSIYTLLMSGVAINFFFSSLIVLIQYLFDFTQTVSILRWLMGGIDVSGYTELKALLPVFFVFGILVFWKKKELLLASADDDFAMSKGLNIHRFRMICFVLVSLIVGSLVSMVGPVGFVGLVVPHLCRLIFKNNIGAVIKASVLIGGLLLAVTDFLARNLIPPVEIPVGVITSLIGAPFFILVLLSQLRRQS